MRKKPANLDGELTVFLTRHAEERIENRFDVIDTEQIRKVLKEATIKGNVSAREDEFFIEHGCLLMAGIHNGNGTLTIQTVLNLSNDFKKDEGKNEKCKSRPLAGVRSRNTGKREVELWLRRLNQL